jgi:hypothetical protein
MSSTAKISTSDTIAHSGLSNAIRIDRQNEQQEKPGVAVMHNAYKLGCALLKSLASMAFVPGGAGPAQSVFGNNMQTMMM